MEMENILITNEKHIRELGFLTVKNYLYEFLQAMWAEKTLEDNYIDFSHSIMRSFRYVYRVKINKHKIVTNVKWQDFDYYQVILNINRGRLFKTTSFIIPCAVFEDYNKNVYSFSDYMHYVANSYRKQIFKFDHMDFVRLSRSIYPYTTLFPTEVI